ncbi:tetratricopeptide repeat protein [Pseudanabaena minima]|uniref:tetratricopeptide repeat protein n=1 Tax=Pseudanabaena minima TaxID=890415 RepID=UPI003DA9A8E7
MTRIFLARTEEQKRFREVLRSLQPNAGSRWFSENLPTMAKLLPAKKEVVSTSPHIFLLYGEGGMGKTSLGRRFCDLAREEFPDGFQVLRLDWEEAKNEYPSLNVGHESIRPESVLETIYLAVSKGREGIFEKYRQVEKTLKQIEEKVDKELQARQGEGVEYAPILKKGLSWSLGALRKLPYVETILGAGDGTVDEAIADGAVSALVGLMKKRLSLEERRIFATPHRQLAEALGHGLQAISAQKPLVLLLDTYEIVDRLECDRVLRMVIKAAGRRVVWAIAGRANLADSYRLSQDYFQGYRDVFSENLYVYPMSEFSWEQVSEYFAHPEINVPLSDKAAESVKQFSLGIPFVVQQIAAMRQQGIDLDTILSAPSADRDDESPREAVVRATSDRFLRYCLDEHDQKAVYAMAMMRRPDNELLKAMLGVTDLEPEMRSLKARHSFVLLEGKGIRLHDKLESFLQDYLRCGLAGQSPMVRELSDRAVAYLEPRLREWTQEFTDTADYFESDRIANGLLDLVQFKFWQDVEVGWRYAVPLFVESWQYNHDWQKQLLGIVEAFQVRFDGDSKKRLRIFTKDLDYYFFDTDSRKDLLDELEKLAKRGWVDGDHKIERMVILFLQHGRLLYKLERYSECLQIYLEAEKQLPETALHLRKDLAEEFENIGNQLTWKDGNEIASPEAQGAYQNSVTLNPENSGAWYGLGVSLLLLSQYESAIAALYRAINIDQKSANPHNSLGNIYKAQGKYELSITSYQQASDLDPKFAYPHNGLGNVYYVQGKYELAIASYQQAINLDPKFANPHNNLGNVYKAQGEYELAIASYQQAIDLDPKYVYPHNGLGNVYKAQGKDELAITSFQQAINLDPKFASSHYNLGNVYQAQGKDELAIASYQQAISLNTKYASPHNGLGNVYYVQGKYELAIASYQQAIDLDPKNAFPHHGLGIVYQEQGNYELAISSYQQAINLDPKYVYLHNDLGLIYIDKGEYELAILSFLKVIDLDPTNASPKFNLSIVMGLQGNQDKAIELLKLSLDLLDDSIYERLFRTLHETAIGELELGINRLKEILETENPPESMLSNALKYAELIARFPTKLEGIDTVIEMLRQAIAKAQ